MGEIGEHSDIPPAVRLLVAKLGARATRELADRVLLDPRDDLKDIRFQQNGS